MKTNAFLLATVYCLLATSFHSSFIIPHSSFHSRSAPAQAAARPEEALVVAHDELRLDLRDGVHRHADQNQQRRAAEVKLVTHALRNPAQAGRARDEFLDPRADEGQATDVEAGEH